MRGSGWGGGGIPAGGRGEASGAVLPVQDRPRQALSGLRTFQPSEHPGPHLVRIGPGSQGPAPEGRPGRYKLGAFTLQSDFPEVESCTHRK